MSNQNQVAKQVDKSTQATQSERFLANVEQQFAAEAGAPMAFTDYEKTLAQHLFLKVDNVLKDFESKRNNPKQLAYTWNNINMRKLALDAVHRVKLGLDALIPNHIHPVPYLNGSTGQYDLDLRVGYVGQAYYRAKSAVDEPIDIVYELVYSNDHFKPIKKSFSNEVESYEFDIKNPFDRGEIIGGFGYLQFENPKKNELVIVTESDFMKSRKAAMTKKFWDDHPEEMRYKTLVHRVTEKLEIDPKKINAASYSYVEKQEQESSAVNEIKQNANTEYIDVQPIDTETGEIKENEPEEIKQEDEPVTQKEEIDPDLAEVTSNMEGQEPQQETIFDEGPAF